ncbi:hypothetical protein B0H13DRAFT_2282055 [Mycena leptocephala]|nr:hypothetical protein B0H13DRAFT_2282055 [Mycena leptocephala]
MTCLSVICANFKVVETSASIFQYFNPERCNQPVLPSGAVAVTMSHHSLLAFPHHLRCTCRRPAGYTWVYAFQMVLGLKRVLSMNQNIDAATGGGEMMIWLLGPALPCENYSLSVHFQ